MNQNFNTKIISPEKIIFSNDVQQVVLPGIEGDMTILYDHIPLITVLRPGIATITFNNNNEKYFVEDGLIEFIQNNLTILSSNIINFQEITKDYLLKITENTKKELNNKNISDQDKYILDQKTEAINTINI
tara:strand:+ start:26 stop:418 length:393 start_codon:yes stop_codon:yes gene_type:complete